MRLFFDTVPIRDIDTRDTFYKITTAEAAEITGLSGTALSASIQQAGLLSPPVLWRRPKDASERLPENSPGNSPNSRYRVVCGFRRIAACRALGWERIHARICDSAAPDPDLLLIAISDNAFHRKLNLMEQAVAAAKLSEYFKDSRALCRCAGAAGLALNPGLLEKLLELNQADGAIQEKVALDRISLTIGLALGALEKPDALMLLEIFDALNPTLNHQKEILRMVKALARLNDVTLKAVLSAEEIRAVLEDTEHDRNWKIRELKTLLRRMRYPEMVWFEKQYAAHAARLKLPEALRLIPPRDFEGNRFSFQGDFSTREDFTVLVRALERLRDHPDFIRILEKDFEDLPVK